MFVTKKKYRQLEAAYNASVKERLDLETKYEMLRQQDYRKYEQNAALVDELYEKEAEIESLKAQLALQVTNTNNNSVTITISDDFDTATPTVKFKPEIHEKMMQHGLIRETGSDKQDAFAIQLALIDMAKDALIQLVNEFSEAIDDD